MKICYIANYLDNSGYSQAARNYILALDHVGVTVVPRAVKMTNETSAVPDRIKELEDNDLNNIDVVIQHNLPDNFVSKSGVKNIGHFAYETNGFGLTNWERNLELLDKILVPCTHQMKIIQEKISGVPVSYVPYALSSKAFDKAEERLTFNLPANTTKFYTIADGSMRKNLPALISAYYSKFSADDQVALIIKTSPSINIKNTIQELKQGSNRFKLTALYPKIVVIESRLSEEQMVSLHDSCDIFVTTSHGESFSLPAVEALARGNYIVAPNCTAFQDYITNDNIGKLVGGMWTSVLGMQNSPNGLYSSEEQWFNVNVSEFGDAMRAALSKKEKSIDRTGLANNQFNYKTIGKALLEAINN